MRRATAHLALLAALAALITVLTGLVTGIPRYLDAAATANARETLSSSSAADVSVQAQVRLAQDALAQDGAITRVIREQFGDAHIMIDRSVQSPPVQVLEAGPAGPVTDAQIVIASVTDPDAVVTVTSGDAGGALLHEGAAAALGVTVGDSLSIAGAEFDVTGLWVPRDPSSPVWLGDALAISGTDGTTVGPLVVPEPELAALDLNPFARWTVSGDSTSVTASELPALAAGAASLEGALRDADGLTSGGVVMFGELAATAGILQDASESVQGVSPVPVVITAVIGGVALVQLGLLLRSVRAQETLLMRARGRSRSQAVVDALIESTALVVPGVALGATVAIVAVPGVDAGASLVTAALTGVAMLIALVATAVVATGGGTASRARRTPLVSLMVLVVAAAALSVWQFLQNGSPFVTTSAGDRVVDPIAVLAPSLALLACAVIGLAVFPAIAATIVRVSERATSLGGVLSARQVSRRIGAFAVPLVLVALAVGGSTLASAYSATWSTLQERAGAVRAGADVRISLPGASVVGGASTIVTSARYDSVGAPATPALVTATEVGSDAVSLIAIASDRFAPVSTRLASVIDEPAITAAIARDPLGVELPETATDLTLAVRTLATPVDLANPLPPWQGNATVVAWVIDSTGSLARLPLAGEPPVDGATLLSSPLPDAVAPWRLLAIDAEFAHGPNRATYDFQVTGISAGDDIAVPTDWMLQPAGLQTIEQPASGFMDALSVEQSSGIGAMATLGRDLAGPTMMRWMPGAADAAPAVISSALSSRLNLGDGDSLSLRFAGTGLGTTVAITGVEPLLPGTLAPLTVMTDLPTLTTELLRSASSIPRPNAIWAGSSPAETDATAQALAELAPPGAVVTTARSGSGEALLRPVVTALWIGSAGALLLAAAAVAAVAGALAGVRRGEVAVLRSLGLSARQQASSRRRELVAVIAAAVALGLAGGAAVSALTVPGLARSAVLDAPRTLPVELALDPIPLVLMMGLFAAACMAVLWWHSLMVARQYAASTGREVST